MMLGLFPRLQDNPFLQYFSNFEYPVPEIGWNEIGSVSHSDCVTEIEGWSEYQCRLQPSHVLFDIEWRANLQFLAGSCHKLHENWFPIFSWRQFSCNAIFRHVFFPDTPTLKVMCVTWHDFRIISCPDIALIVIVMLKCRQSCVEIMRGNHFSWEKTPLKFLSLNDIIIIFFRSNNCLCWWCSSLAITSSTHDAGHEKWEMRERKTKQLSFSSLKVEADFHHHLQCPSCLAIECISWSGTRIESLRPVMFPCSHSLLLSWIADNVSLFGRHEGYFVSTLSSFHRRFLYIPWLCWVDCL